MSNWHGRVCVSDCGWAARIRTRTKVRPCVRIGMVRLRVRKGENGALLQVGIRGLSPFPNSVNLSHLVFCENIACRPHHCSCIGALDSAISGPIVAFSAERFCRGFWRGFLLRASKQTSDWAFVECFGKGFLRGTSIGFPRAFCGGFHRAFRRGFHGAFAGILTGIPTGFREVQPTFRGKQTPTIDSLRNESRSTCSRFRVLNAAASCGKKGDD